MFVIKLRGLPWSCTTEDIVKFMEGVVILSRDDEPGKPAIYLMTNSDGRPSGEAFIQVGTEVDVEAACNKNNQLMGQRYIEVFRSNPDQLNRHLNESQCNSQNWRDPVVRLRGLPYGCEKKDIVVFFEGLSTTEDGIMMVIDFSGRFNGEAFVQFGSNEDALKALDRHKQKISNRYIEVFRSTFTEMEHYEQGGNAGNMNGGNQYGGDNDAYNGGFNNNRGGRGGFNDNRGGRGGFHENGMRGGNNFNGRGGFRGNDRAKPYSRYDNGGNNYNRRSGSQDYDGGYGTNNNGRGSWNNNPRGGRGNYNNNMNSYNSYTSRDNGGYNNNGYDGYGGNDNGNNYNGGGYNHHEGKYGNNCGPMHGVKMRGLPFQATEKDISDFFMPLQPTSVRILTGRDRRPTGEGEVDFATHGDALKAMERDKKYMGKRYVELFLLSEPGNDRTPNPPPGSITPPETTMSLGSLMNKNFNSVAQPPQPMLPSLFTNFESYGSNPGAKPVPPPMPLKGQPPLPPMPSSNVADTGSTYSTNINELLMAEMAQKMFASAYTHFQASQGSTGPQTNMNQYSQHQPPPPPPPPQQQQQQQRGRFYKD